MANQYIIPAEFNGTSLNIIDRDGQKWLTAEEVGRCLGYDESNARKGVLKLFERHGDEFSETDTTVVKLTTVDGKNREVRCFSAEGCVLLAMFANSPRAKEFRQWAKRVLASQPAPAVVEAPVPAPVDLTLAREIGQLKDLLAHQGQMILGLYQQVDSARRGHIRSLSRMLTMQTQQQNLLAAQEKREARELILQLEAEGVPRAIISQRTGRTLNHVRQVIFQDKQARGAVQPASQSQLALGV